MNQTELILHDLMRRSEMAGAAADTKKTKSPVTERASSQRGINIKIHTGLNSVCDELERFTDELFDEFADEFSQTADDTQSAAMVLLKMIEAGNAQKQAFAHKLERLREQSEMHKEAMEAVAEHMENRRRALIIAMRITTGDNVPQQDRQFLIKHSPEMYMKANLMQRQQ